MTETTWTDEQLKHVGDTPELQLASARPDGTLRPFVTMWVVRAGDDLYVRSAYGSANPWYRRAKATGVGRIRAGGVERDVTFADAAPDAHAAIDAAYHAKYDRYGPQIVGSVVGPQAEAVTVHLVPRAGRQEDGSRAWSLVSSGRTTQGGLVADRQMVLEFRVGAEGAGPPAVGSVARVAGRSAATRRAVLAIVLAVLAACGGTSDDDDAASETTASPATELATAPAAPLDVDVVTETFVDTSRPTAKGSETPAGPDRTIVTRIAHPTSGGPYPLVVLSHGITGHPDEYADTIPAWAADGFVVASPTFPLTNRGVPGALANAGDVANQPGDVSFVIDEVLVANDDPSSPLHGVVDPEATGVAGHSLGGATTWAVSFNTATRDERIDSTVIFAGLAMPMPGGEFEFDSGLPLLVLHGDEDDLVLDTDLAAYEQAASPKWFVTLLGATHVPAFTDDESPYDGVTRTVLDFWHGTLDGDARALERVTADATDPALSSVRHE